MRGDLVVANVILPADALCVLCVVAVETELSLCFSSVYHTVPTGWSTVSGFDHTWFSSLSSKHLCVFGLNGAI